MSTSRLVRCESDLGGCRAKQTFYTSFGHVPYLKLLTTVFKIRVSGCHFGHGWMILSGWSAGSCPAHGLFDGHYGQAPKNTILDHVLDLLPAIYGTSTI